ncbi:nodulation protein NfeD [Candidatus Bathyarchaeota archaeon]|nr:nodulation protein NfeD [Candidatus Bathyarchaeota archaeon]
MRNLRKIAIVLLILIFLETGINLSFSVQDENVIVKVEVNSEITLATNTLLDNALKFAEAKNAKLIIVILNTPGGEVDAVKNIMNLFDNSTIPVCCFVYPAGATAWSGGTYILMASHIAVMASGTTIGSCQPVLSTGQPIEYSKYINALATLMVNHAKMHCRNETLARIFVTENKNVGPEEAIKFHVVEFVANSISTLLRKLENFTLVYFQKPSGVSAWKLVPNSESKNYSLTIPFTDITKARMIEYTPGLQTFFLTILLNPLVSSLLLIIGMFLIFIGIKTPGFGAEIAGGICVFLALIAFGVIGVALGAVVLFAVGAALIIAELKTHIGVLAISGAVCMIIASVLLFPSPQWLIYSGVSQRIQTVLLITAITMACLFSFIVYKAAKAKLSKVKTGREALLGARGIVVRDLKPEGEVRVMGEFWHAKSVDEWIKKGETVEVVNVEGLTLIVKRLREKS